MAILLDRPVSESSDQGYVELARMPAALAPIITWMVARDPEDRPRSYRELRDALVALCERNPIASPDGSPAAAIPTPLKAATTAGHGPSE